jgi:gliding motility-associated-like protein
MKQLLLIFFIFTFTQSALARHITGGEVIYEYNGPGAGSSKNYTITLRLFRDNAGGGAAMPDAVSLGVFNNDNNTLLSNVYRSISKQTEFPVSVISKPACLINEPAFNYSMGLYVFTIDLPNNTNGYTITYQTCCRVNNITNIGNGPTGMVGSTYTGEIPGSSTLGSLLTDNSARFETGISIICDSKPFKLDFSATDLDNTDVLKYEFYNAFNGGTAIGSGFSTPAPPPYGSISYDNPYSGFQPLGPLATINVNTGIISGISPSSGKYVVGVNVKSFRNGVLIASHKKDFIVTVAPCDFSGADLSPNFIQNCDSLNTAFANKNSSAQNITYDWDFGDPASGILNFSTEEAPKHQFLTFGDYWVKLTINKLLSCPSTDSVLVKVYPGFFPKFDTILPQCKNTPIQFKDLSTTNYPFINFWKWDFGVTTLTNDTSRLPVTTYTYTAAGTYNASFIVQTSRGCRDTLYPIVKILDEPDLKITNDTLICTVDTLQLKSNVTTGTITWSPDYMIESLTSFNPKVSPDVTTTYTAFYEDQFGCSGSKKVTIKVVSAVTLLAANDTTICRTDKAQLTLNTDALYFIWTPKALMQDSTVKNPIVTPINPSDTFRVRALISNKCFKDKAIIVKTVPYPIPLAADATICFGKSVPLFASGGSSYVWSPSTYLTSTTIPNPIAQFPLKTLNYTVSVKDTLGCPKPVTKIVKLEVIKIKADAGPSDTSIVIGQPLYLQAVGSTKYNWVTPNIGLSATDIFNPVANPIKNITYKVIVSNEFGCADTDTINVKVFSLPPDLYVPTAFTPSSDGINDLFRPICLGIKKLENFSVYNRWGVLLFTTNRISDGWDGTFKGIAQDPAAYVWTANAIDYKNNKIFRKGSVILIR